ncbi:TPA: cell division protein ZapA [Streptococcus suis]|nr:cell division protein ZapA [Streptococcus suis]HEM3560219.1 cell division protein ZapA [Streptococcus suis]
MANLNRYKFTFGEKQLTVTTEHDNLFMEEIERVVQEKYQAIKEKMPTADPETLALLLAINALSVQLTREMVFEQKEQELASVKEKVLKKNVTLIDLDELEDKV